MWWYILDASSSWVAPFALVGAAFSASWRARIRSRPSKSSSPTDGAAEACWAEETQGGDWAGGGVPGLNPAGGRACFLLTFFLFTWSLLLHDDVILINPIIKVLPANQNQHQSLESPILNKISEDIIRAMEIYVYKKSQVTAYTMMNWMDGPHVGFPLGFASLLCAIDARPERIQIEQILGHVSMSWAWRHSFFGFQCYMFVYTA